MVLLWGNNKFEIDIFFHKNMAFIKIYYIFALLILVYKSS